MVWEGWHREVSPYPDPCPNPAIALVERGRLSWVASGDSVDVAGAPSALGASRTLSAIIDISQIAAAYLSSHQSSRRLLLKMLSTIIVGPLT